MLSKQRFYIVSGLFLFSGFTALVYQVVWMRNLSLFFGSDIYATSITLSVFMGGLAVGSILVSKIVDRINKPLILYGILEILIGSYALLFPSFLYSLTHAYKYIYRTFFETTPIVYQSFRIAVAGISLIIPTILMGATLPLIVRSFLQYYAELGKRVGFFYAINTLGALAGTIVVGFILLPHFGTTRTVQFAFLINLTIGLTALLMGMRQPQEALAAPSRIKREENGVRNDARYHPSVAQTVIGVMFLSGMAALALEVVWTRIQVQSFSATVYSFSIMLASFLFGIFFGSHQASKWLDRNQSPSELLAHLELWLGATVAILAVLVYTLPHLFGRLLWTFVNLGGGSGFGVGGTAAKAIVSLLFICIPTIMLGMTFPVAVKCYTAHIKEAGKRTGQIYAANTAGALMGSLAGGFILIPFLGSKGALLAISALFLLSGSLMVCAIRRQDGSFIRLRSFLWPVLVAVMFSMGSINLPRQTALNFNLQKSTSPKIIYQGEGIGHNVTISQNSAGYTIMYINGNIEADTSLVQRRHFILKGHLPLLLHEDPKDVAVVGLGLGITLAAVNRHPTVDHIELIELSPEMIEAHENLKPLTGDILSSEKISVRLDDARNYLSMTEASFDMITADPIHPRISGVGFLYTQEYYKTIKQRLRPGGIVCQWMPMYHISKKSFDIAFRTFATVFPNASFWYVKGHGLFLASVEPFQIDFHNVQERFLDPSVRTDFSSINIKSPEELLGHMLMGPNEIKSYLSHIGNTQINTDNNAYLEYHTPFEYLETTRSIVETMLPYANLDLSLIRNASPETQQNIVRVWNHRKTRILPELLEKNI